MRQRSLRLRLTIAVGLGAALLSVLFALLAYFGMRHVLVTERQSSDLRQSYLNAALVRSDVLDGRVPLTTLVANLDGATSSSSIVEVKGQWFARNLADPSGLVPMSVRRVAARDEVSRQVVVTAGSPTLVIDVPLPAVSATYYQLDNLHDLDHSLGTLALVLALAAFVTTSLGVLGGRWIIRRAMAPLEVASEAARRVAGGALDTRIPGDPGSSEVTALAESFNTMVARLVERLERDARFAGDVSHELRSPLTTLATSVEVMRRHRGELAPEGQAALDLLTADISIFQGLVEDLLEVSRYEAGATSLNLETVELADLVSHCVASAVQRHALADVPIEEGPGFHEVHVRVDRRRFERVITNLLDNAERYGNGAVAVRLGADAAVATVDVDDAGPGVDEREVDKVFDRFYRGSAANARGIARGTGLGLALVADHVRHFGGHVELLRSPEGGARFRLVLPLAPPEEEEGS